MATEGSRARLGDASARRGEGDARRADRPRGDADEYRRGRILEIDGLPDGRSDRLWSGYRLASMDDDPVGSERFLSELLPAFGAADPRAAAFRILGLQLPEELRHLERDLFGLRLGSMERGHVPHEVHVQIDLGSFRDALEPMGLEAHVESLAVVQRAERDDVEGLAFHAVAQRQDRGLDGVECHPPREGRLHRSSLQLPYATFADTSEYPSGHSSSRPISTTRIFIPGSTPTGWQRRKFGQAPFEQTSFSYAKTAPSTPTRAERLQSGAIGSTSTTRARSSFRRHGCATSRTRVIRYRRPRSWLRHALRTLHGVHSGCGPR